MRQDIRVILVLTVVLALLATGPAALAAKGGNGGGKPGGGDGGGEDPAANPEIACIQPGSSTYDLVVMNADGTNLTVVVANAGGSLMAPSWAPDGSEIVFNGTIGGVAGLYAVDLGGLVVEQIVAGEVFSPACSPVADANGDYAVAYYATGVGPNTSRMDLFVVQRDGTGGQSLTTSYDVAERYPTWSPEGDRIAVVAADFAAGRADVVVYDLGSDVWSGTGTPPSTNVTNDADCPLQSGINFSGLDWSRTAGSGEIALAVEVAGQNDIWILDVDAAATAWQATDTSTIEIEPSWSPADLELVFRRAGRGKVSGLYLITPGSAGETKIGDKSLQAPDWKR